MEKDYFKTFAEEFVKDARREIAGILAGQCCIRKLDIEGILEGINSVIGEICLRPLLIEFRLCDLKGKLKGETVREKLTDYKKSFLSDPQYRESVLRVYPELKGLCQYAAERQKRNVMEMLYRLIRDKTQIEETLLDGIPFCEVKRIQLGRGDLHCQGRGVIELSFDQGKSVYYKPRSLEAERIFYGLSDRIKYAMSGEKDVFSSILKCLCRDAYGWMKKVPHRECASGEEIRCFYRRLGIQAGISYLFGSHDLHYQNLIAYGAYPVFIDLENIFLTDEEDDMTYSVLDSSLFPAGISADIYAAVTGGEEGEWAKREVPVIRESDGGLRIVYERPLMEKGENRPRKAVNLEEYLDDLLRGFDFTYEYLQRMREEELTGLLGPDVASRCLIHGTQFYRSVLDASFHPSLLSKEGERKVFIDRMCPEGPEKQYETEDLEKGDIPYFYRYADGRSLYSSSGEEMKGYFRETVREAVLRRKRAMNGSDRKRQEGLIRISLKLGGIREKDLIDSSYPFGTTDDAVWDWAEMAERIADSIAERAFWNEERTEALWAGLEYSDRKGTDVAIGRPDYYLYGGLAGIILFMRAAKLAYGKYGGLCEAVERRLFSYTEDVLSGKRKTQSSYTGLFCGEASVLYAYQRLYGMTGNSRYLLYAGKHAEIVRKLAHGDEAYDLMYGNAGAVIALCGLFDLTGETVYLEYAQETELFLRALKKTEEMGIAHGNSGLIRCYGRLSGYCGENSEYERILTGLLARENALFRERLSGGSESEQRRELPSWCHGDLGILYSYLELRKHTGDRYSRFTDCVLERAEEIMQGTGLRKSMCLCHGNMGNLLLLKACQKDLGERTDLAHIFEQEVRRLLGRKGILMPVEKVDFGLMLGLAGIGLGCLMLADHLLTKTGDL